MAATLAPTVNVKDLILSNAPLGPQEVQQVSRAVAADFSNYRLLSEAVHQLETQEDASPAGQVRLGVCQYLLGRYRQSAYTLTKGDGGAMAHFYMGRARFALEDYQGALDSYQSAAKAGYMADVCQCARAEALRYQGHPAEALKVLDGLKGAVEHSAEYLYQRGATLAALGAPSSEVVALYEKAVEADDTHPGALFGLAMENDRSGNDDTAMDLYQRSAARVPTHVGVLLNLGILFEDRQQFDRARQCYLRILDADPANSRARLFLKDANAAGAMEYDEDAQRRRDRLSQVMNVPVTDFELSVRSRNCLQKMGIMTLGDLARTSEQELLASKNFGETSLHEIKEMMSSRGLELGMLATERPRIEPIPEPTAISADEQALLNKPISDLNLSVRARKCMARLNIATLGELIRHTGDELLECKNFGVTSLNEVREKLQAYSLKLRGD